jgi:hypothetical protein
MKTCKKCGEPKSISEFHRDKSSKDGRSGRCKVCKNTWARDYKNNTEEGRKLARERHLKDKYNLSLAGYDYIWDQQGGVCRICGGTNKDGRRLSVDHDHTTNKIRGLLCDPCNRGIGLLGDDPSTLRKAADYIERSR